ncbi:hypothetical protein DW974_08910 [Lachnospiraceae bacterium AM48-27BH]|nr:hypothetical protein DW974_08910 [Lachnospiraceae bacterium AM48-27BH]
MKLKTLREDRTAAERKSAAVATRRRRRILRAGFYFKLQQNDLMLLTYPFHLFRPDTCLYLSDVGAV